MIAKCRYRSRDKGTPGTGHVTRGLLVEVTWRGDSWYRSCDEGTPGTGHVARGLLVQVMWRGDSWKPVRKPLKPRALLRSGASAGTNKSSQELTSGPGGFVYRCGADVEARVPQQRITGSVLRLSRYSPNTFQASNVSACRCSTRSIRSSTSAPRTCPPPPTSSGTTVTAARISSCHIQGRRRGAGGRWRRGATGGPLEESRGGVSGTHGCRSASTLCRAFTTTHTDLGLGYVLRQVGSGPVTLAHRLRRGNSLSPVQSEARRDNEPLRAFMVVWTGEHGNNPHSPCLTAVPADESGHPRVNWISRQTVEGTNQRRADVTLTKRREGVQSGSYKASSISIYQRVADLGLLLQQDSNRSKRICKTCLNAISRLEHDLPIPRKWEQDEETLTETATTNDSSQSREKRERSTPSKTPRKHKKQRRSSPTQAATRRSITQQQRFTSYLRSTFYSTSGKRAPDSAIGKQKELAATCGERLQDLKVSTELYLTSEAEGQMAGVHENIDNLTLSDVTTECGDSLAATCGDRLQDLKVSTDLYVTSEAEGQMASVNENLEDLTLSDATTESRDSFIFSQLAICDATDVNDPPATTPSEPPPTYSIRHTSNHHSPATNLFTGSITLPLRIESKQTTSVMSGHTYVPSGPDGLKKVLVGGDRLTEGNCHNLQWAFADGGTEEARLEGLVFKFEDWHAIRNLLEHFLRKDTAALFLAAAMEHFGLQGLSDMPEDFVPAAVALGSQTDQNTWLHEKNAEVIDNYVMKPDIFSKEADHPQPQFPCRHPGCVIKVKKDSIKEHSEARLGFSFLLLNMMDAVKEGDGERLMHLYQVALLFIKRMVTHNMHTALYY
ncbi:hypothetical protein WMY93_000017 [Mugilogobius chulae]|uniref:Uncharacterized protein n=1 Tax=Mugilogobius chulae TaxID=88201 RepID=A0AAW0PY67_9GOBI